ncbi:hypothetical protein [Micromonospora sp. DPT]|uniref:hypothetical protein n=1 Tax=Micromonospora sp. DPT TaxID=3142975 RepID=UPI003208D868
MIIRVNGISTDRKASGTGRQGPQPDRRHLGAPRDRPDQPKGGHAADYLRGYTDWWGNADVHLCGGQVIVC